MNYNLHLHPSPDHISDTIRSGRFYEQHVLEEFQEYIPNEGTFLDIGANIGNHSLMFQQIFHERKIVCFEASPMNFVLLQHNLSPFENITPICCGLGEKFEVVKFVHFPQNYGGSGVVSNYPTHIDGMPIESYPKISVITNRLDEFGLTDISFIKMDIEGHEMFAIKGGIETIKRDKPLIWLEDFHYDHNIDKSPTQYLIDNLEYELIKRVECNFLLR